MAQKPAAGAKSNYSAAQLVEQGKTLYRAQHFKPALAKFEAALKLEPENDEALSLAAVTAFRLDLQAQSRDYFIRRADLKGQKDSVKAFSYYRAALTYWREVHDLVAKFVGIKENRVIVTIPDQNRADIRSGIKNGLEYADRALAIIDNFAEAQNVKNLLHAEAALSADSEETAVEHRWRSVECLRRAIELSKSLAGVKRGDVADFSAPTIRVSEFAQTDEEEGKIEDPMKKLIAGGRPVKRMQAIFPGVRPAKAGNQDDPSSKGLTKDGGAYSLGAGRGALTAAYAPGIVKVEILVSVTGEVVFAHVVDGRSDLNGEAILAARAWKFEPAKFEGKQVQVSGMITFDMKPAGGRQVDGATGRQGEGEKGKPGDKEIRR
ncbi:MAG TPA: energy transducer TonB [Blastocatellia bacterium]|jgi:tetratricopeptide (TPR) repeat protein|nr:energy transducer TonB [Blastocatellia bacterium]